MSYVCPECGAKDTGHRRGMNHSVGCRTALCERCEGKGRIELDLGPYSPDAQFIKCPDCQHVLTPIEAGQLRRLPRGRVAHIVTHRETELWMGEGMSVCGNWLLLSADELVSPASKVPICTSCVKVAKATGLPVPEYSHVSR